LKQGPSEILMLNLGQIELSSDNPRTDFSGEELRQLSESLRTDGMIEPIIVRKSGQKYEIVVGERRARAAAYAGLSKIPSIVRNVGDEEASRIRLIENMTRKDLDVFERVAGIKNYMSRYRMPIPEMARILHKSPTTLQGWFKVAESTSPKMRSSDKLRKLGLELLREIAKYNDETQERLAEVIVENGLIVHQARRLLNAFERKPDLKRVGDVARRIKDEYRTVTITVPASRAKEIKRKLEREGHRQEREKVKAKARLQKHLRRSSRRRSANAGSLIPTPTPLEAIKIPYEAKSALEGIVKDPARQIELAKLVQTENFDADEASHLANLARHEPRLSARELIKRVVEDSDRRGKIRFMVVGMRPKFVEIVKEESAKRNSEPKETVIELAAERLSQLGYKL
jgi:ParB family chromosome partitioning protein